MDAMEGNPLCKALELWASSRLAPGEERALTATELHDELMEVSGFNVRTPNFPRSPKALSQFLRRDLGEYERAADLCISMDPRDRDPKDRKKQIRLQRRDPPAGSP
jgi:hypothetical protein